VRKQDPSRLAQGSSQVGDRRVHRNDHVHLFDEGGGLREGDQVFPKCLIPCWQRRTSSSGRRSWCRLKQWRSSRHSPDSSAGGMERNPQALEWSWPFHPCLVIPGQPASAFADGLSWIRRPPIQSDPGDPLPFLPKRSDHLKRLEVAWPSQRIRM
jgi:hypothetical protein